MDAARYKHVVLWLIFLKYIADAFEERHAALEAEAGPGADPEDPGVFLTEVCGMPQKDLAVDPTSQRTPV